MWSLSDWIGFATLAAAVSATAFGAWVAYRRPHADGGGSSVVELSEYDRDVLAGLTRSMKALDARAESLGDRIDDSSRAMKDLAHAYGAPPRRRT